jgi:MarR family transcriptional regulator, transcriptional regulator for hemolysin
MKFAPTNTLGFLLHDASRLLRRRFEARAQDFGLSSAQWRLLVHLAREGSASQARIADLLEIEPISVSRLVDRMEQGGWVERGSDPNDRRVRLLEPSAKALAAFEGLREMAGRIYEQAMAGMSAEDRAALTRSLELLVANLGRLNCDDAAVDRARKGAAE